MTIRSIAVLVGQLLLPNGAVDLRMMRFFEGRSQAYKVVEISGAWINDGVRRILP
jgi:hypothetical protein